MCERHFDVEHLLRPVEAARFFQQYWGQQPWGVATFGSSRLLEG